jgi:hypothetical protein
MRTKVNSIYYSVAYSQILCCWDIVALKKSFYVAYRGAPLAYMRRSLTDHVNYFMHMSRPRRASTLIHREYPL